MGAGRCEGDVFDLLWGGGFDNSVYVDSGNVDCVWAERAYGYDVFRLMEYECKLIDDKQVCC